MLNRGIRILNFDNSVVRQKELIARYASQTVDFTSLAEEARLFMSALGREKIIKALKGTDNSRPTFIGSGDFHHASEILSTSLEEPFCAIVFDFHPDWDILPPRFGCGSWVSRLLENRNMLKCVLIGMGSEDLSWPALQTGNLGALSGGRLEIYPFRHRPTTVYCRRISGNHSLRVEKGFLSNRILWHELEKEEDLGKFILDVIAGLPVRRAYVSIDKDCLKKEFALTNWEEGFLSLGQLISMLSVARENLDIAGLDITGDYSAPFVSRRLKNFLSRLDHPAALPVDGLRDDFILRVNEKTNLEILRAVIP